MCSWSWVPERVCTSTPEKLSVPSGFSIGTWSR